MRANTKNDHRIYDVNVSLEQLIALKPHAERISLSHNKAAHAFQSGTKLSVLRGRGMEFEEVRHYQPGDDIRTMDWRVTARTGHPHTKIFREERERPIYYLVDLNPSMFFGTRVTFKSVIALQVAAMTAWHSALNGDRVGGFISTPERTIELAPKGGTHGLLPFLKAMCQQQNLKKQNSSQFQNSISHCTRVIKPGSVVVIISDFMHCDANFTKHLTRLFCSNDVLTFFVYDELEQQAPPPNIYNISDGNDFFSFDTANKTFRQHYEEHFSNRFELISSFCKQHQKFMLPIATHEDVINKLKLVFSKVKV